MKHADSNVSDGVDSWVAVPEDGASTNATSPEQNIRSEDSLVVNLTKMGFEKERVELAIGELRGAGAAEIDADSVIGWIMGESKSKKDSSSSSGSGDVLPKNSTCTIKDEVSTEETESGTDDKVVTSSGINDGMNDNAPKPSGNPSEDEASIIEKGTNTASNAPKPIPEDAELLSDDIDGARSSVDPSLRHHSAAYLTSALESLESMRKLNLEVEFSDAGGPPVCHEKCTHCQREALCAFLASGPPEHEKVAADARAGLTIGKVTLDGSRLRRFKTNMEEVKLDGSRLRQLKSNMEEVKLDGSRLRRFGSNVGSLFSKSAAVANVDANAQDMSGKVTEEITQLRPSSLDKDATSTNESTANETESTDKTEHISGITRKNSNSAAQRCNILAKPPQPCLTCGHPTCSKHSSPAFSKNRIVVCQPCARLFELDHLMDAIESTASQPIECQRKVDHMVDCYDRAKFLLVYTSQYADDIAASLETHTVRSNRIGAGSSATGMVSGITGVVGCGALLCPPVAAAGVPLLIASLVFGGSATVAQTGDAAAKYYSEPNRLAEKMVALHGMVLSLLRITEVLSHGLLKKHLGVNYSVEGLSEGEEAVTHKEVTSQHKVLAKEINELLEKHGVSRTTAAVGGLQSAVTSGIVATELATTVSTTRAVASGMRMGRVGTAAAASARFVPIAGGLLSAACVVVEGRELKKTLDKIGEGDPCAKAAQVRSIRDELDALPDSSLIAAECQRVFELARREKMKKAELAENGSRTKQGLNDGGGDLAMEGVSQGNISDLIDVMETAAEVDAMEASEPVPGN